MIGNQGHHCEAPVMWAGLYLILDEQWATRCSLVNVMRQAGEAGVKLVQYRNKMKPMQEVYRTALELRRVAARCHMTFIVNDRCDLALAVESDGIHLGQTDLPVPLARNVVGEKMSIGLSTHAPDQVQRAAEEGADYVGYGPVFATGTKINPDPVVGIRGLSEIRALTTLPVFAIGGITLDSVPALRAAGANGVAVASAILDAADPRKAMAQFMAAFQ